MADRKNQLRHWELLLILSTAQNHGVVFFDEPREVIPGACRDTLHRYLQAAPMGHIRHDLRHCFDMHLNYLEHGAMLPDLNLAQFGPYHVPAADKD